MEVTSPIDDRKLIEGDTPDRKLAQEDVLFCEALPRENRGSTQWEEATAAARYEAGRPILTENRLKTFTAQVVNDGRQPADSGAGRGPREGAAAAAG